MRIDQRNAGAAVTTHGSFVTDRWACAFANGSASGISVQQSSTVPSSAGFINSLVYTVTTGGAVGATGSYGLQQRIEGYNFSDILSGTASAKQFTVSFWVRSSITGTYGMAFRNSARDRSYIATYAVSSANTWEQKAVTVTADTSGTWLTTNGTGLDVFFDLGAGTSGSTTAGSWQAGNYIGLTGGVKLVETSGATFYITGVQLEKGSTATDFEYMDYSRQLQMCQRYYEKSYGSTQLPGAVSVLAGASGPAGNGGIPASTAGECCRGFRLGFAAQKRTTPTMVLYDWTGTANAVRVYPADGMRGGVTSLNYITDSGSSLNINFDSSSAQAITASSVIAFNWTATAEL
tara:strand:- start:275 stop:1318 length:1044 start_codon:yes stop_codon:yes gene_type:complete